MLEEVEMEEKEDAAGDKALFLKINSLVAAWTWMAGLTG